MTRSDQRSAALVAATVLGVAVGADPVYTGNHAPVAGLVGFPSLRDATVLPQGAFRAELQGSLANNHSTSTSADETVNLDGETQSITGRATYGLGGGWDVEAAVAWTRHSQGVLDRWIENWHDLWGLPDGDRPGAPRDRLDFRYRGPDARFVVDETKSGLARIDVAVTRSLWQSGAHSVSARAGVKFGMGEAQDLLGGEDDGYVAVQWTRNRREGRGLAWHAQLGWSRAGGSPVLGEIAQRSPWFAGAGVEWRVWRRLHLNVQLDAHAAVADAALTELGDTTALLTVAGTWALAPRWELEVGFTEDIAPRTGPDFTPRLGVRYRPAGR